MVHGGLHLRTEVRLTQWSLLQPVCAYEAPGDPFKGWCHVSYLYFGDYFPDVSVFGFGFQI